MGSTAVEKILARASRKSGVKAGDIIYPSPEIVVVHDGLVSTAKQILDEAGITKLKHPETVFFFTDHEVVYTNARSVARGALNRKVARELGVGNFFDAGRGGHGNIVPFEGGHIGPGSFYFDNDRHCTNAGAVGAFAMRVGAEIATVMATGTVWTKVPTTVKVSFRGQRQPGTHARDVGFYLSRHLSEQKLDLDYRILEMGGDLSSFDLSERVALCSSPTEMGAVGVFIPPDDAVTAYCNAAGGRSFQPVYSDPDAEFESVHTVDLSAIAPQVVTTGGVWNSQDIDETNPVPIDHAFIGSCSSGMYEDMLDAARILKGNTVADQVRLFVVPATTSIMRQLEREGILRIFSEAGAILLPPGCGPCNDGILGPLHSGETSISTAVSNERGRFGADDSECYLASPATVAASAVTGAITDPRTF